MEQNKKDLAKKIAIGALCVLAAVYLLYHIALSMKKDVELLAARPYTAEDVQSFTGYLFRDETVLVSYSGGTTYLHYDNGEKVSVGSAVADIYRFGGGEVVSQLTAVEKQITILQKASAVSGLTVEAVQSQIDRLTYEISEKTAAGKTAAADALGDELLVLLAKKDLMTEGRTHYDTEIASLEAQRARLIAALGTPGETVNAPVSGYFYAGTDGYESLFTTEAAQSLTMASYDTLTASSPQASGNAVGTLMTDFLWYFAAKVPAEDAEGFAVGSTYDCRFPDNSYTGTLKMKIHAKQIEGDAALIVFSSSTIPAAFDMTRCQRMEAVRTTYSGYRVPVDEVRVRDGITYVYIFKKGCAREREIGILWEQNGYFIVSETYESPTDAPVLKLNDFIIVGERNLYDGKIID